MAKLTGTDGGGSYNKGPIQSEQSFQLRASLTAPTNSAARIIYMDSSDDLFWWDGAVSTQLNVSGGASGNSLDGSYEQGRTIDLDRGSIQITDSSTSTLHSLEFIINGAKSGNVIDIGMDAVITGDAIALDMNLALAARGLFIDNGAGARTGADILVTANSTSAHNVLEINDSGSGATVGFNFTCSANGSPGGQALSLTFDNADGLDTEAILITRGTGTRTASALQIDDSGTGSAAMIDINLTGVYTGDMMTFESTDAATGNVLFFNMDNAVAMTSIHLEGSGTRTQPFFELHSDSTGSANYIDINISGAGSGNVIDITTSAAATGNAIFMNLDSAVAMTGLHIEGSGVRTQPMIEIITDSTSSASLIDISVDGAITGTAAIDIDMNAGVAAAALFIDAGNAVRTADIIDCTFDGSGNVSFLDLNVTNTGSGNLFDVDISGLHTGDAFSIIYSSAASTGSALAIETGTNLAGNAIKITTAGARSAPVINIIGAATDAGTDDHVFLITQSGVLDSNLIQLTYDTNASTGEAISVAMGTNVAGSALVVTASGSRTDDLFKVDDSSTSNSSCFDINLTGAFTTGVAFDLNASGAHTSGLMKLTSNSSNSGARNLLEVVNDNTAATGTIPFNIQQDAVVSTNFKKCMEIAGFTIYISDGAAAEGNLTGVVGDLCLNGGTGNGQLAFCDANGTNWTNM